MPHRHLTPFLIHVFPSGEPLSYFFDKLPDRKQYPDYYKIIKDPISLNTLKKRILAKKYTTWAAFEEDVTLIHTNAATYNEAGSAIIKDALKLKVTNLFIILQICPSDT